MNLKVVCGLMAIILTMFLMGCAPNVVEENSIEVLNEEEMAFFNGDSFFNGEYINICNQFLSSIYERPESIDLYGLFYVGSAIDETISEDELLDVMNAAGISGTIESLPSPCEKNSLSIMNEILTQYMDITVEATDKVGLENMIFLEEYDAYYHFHGDTNYRSLITFKHGEREGNQVRLYYEDVFFGDGEKVVTLLEQKGDYKFVSNQYLENDQ